MYFQLKCGVRQRAVLSLVLFVVYTGDLLNKLRLAGYGVQVGAQYMGSLFMLTALLYKLLAVSCNRSQKMLNMCKQCGYACDITFNQYNSH